MLDIEQKLPSSFRDPAGFLFKKKGEIYRQINEYYAKDYEKFMVSGLYQRLVDSKQLVPHQEVSLHYAFHTDSAAKVIKPLKIPFISYPFEWSFSQLKEAALLTLKIQQTALHHEMSLKDASAYNVQFYEGKAIFIDSLSFSAYEEGLPWGAYRQFCQHFLAPLMLMKYTDVRLNQLLKNYIDGIPLDLASKLLPKSTFMRLSCLLHIHMHAKMQQKYQSTTTKSTPKVTFTKIAFQHLISSLISVIERLSLQISTKTEWFDYYEANNNYTAQSIQEKERIIDTWLKGISPQVVWDLGANTGRFSMIASQYAAQVVAWDIDTSCVESLYRQIQTQNIKNILPLFLDLTNPSPAIGWAHQERSSFMQRGNANAILALGLIHHLAIVNNLPLPHIGAFFKDLCEILIIEFVPKEDSQVQKLLATRDDIFLDYNVEHFEKSFNEFFDILDKFPIMSTHRTMYLMKRRSA